ncbi:hypothetical protein IscW_ISCW022926 [Ixodes scapularis]|uniref:Uncharacterized protein n=1 Tax=Ixodes scapularis TaxID=6945 RepID=B7QCW1_IXOSC|nr:hypothetical protein IscW_ISCW022926 [Ixodes scapularis]|eukprot:XP_002413375.1 hypothetical protein IscW_ISCW022926 [Ixodes scapularis]
MQNCFSVSIIRGGLVVFSANRPKRMAISLTVKCRMIAVHGKDITKNSSQSPKSDRVPQIGF